MAFCHKCNVDCENIRMLPRLIELYATNNTLMNTKSGNFSTTHSILTIKNSTISNKSDFANINYKILCQAIKKKVIAIVKKYETEAPFVQHIDK